MSRTHRITNLFAVVLPFAAFLGAIVLLWHRAVGWTDLAIFAVMYVATGFGITIGYHRLFTHRAFETSKAMRVLFAILGSMAVEGSVITWVADHRKHHAFADEEGDPHSPHVDRGPGIRGALHGLYHAHLGWMLGGDGHGRASAHRFAPDLVKDKPLRWVNRTFLFWVLLSLALPFLLGLAITGTLVGGLLALLWGGFVRIFLLHHVTWSINSVCHFFGARRFDTDDESRNVFWLALPSLGESWHHNHHAFPTSAFHGLRPIEKLTDPAGLTISALEKSGLIWNVVHISPERQAEKVLAAAA